MTQYETMPMVRLTVDGMKHQIIQYLGDWAKEYDSAVEPIVDRAIKDYFSTELPEEVTRLVADAIQREIKGYFTYGEGGQAIKETVHAALNDLLKRPTDD